MAQFWREQIKARGCRRFVDVFCGSGAVLAFIGREFPDIDLVGNDAHPAVIPLLRAVGEGWAPPAALDESEYNRVRREVPPSDPLHGFVAFGCSFSGKCWGGYARPHKKQMNKAGAARKALLRDASVFARTVWCQVDFAQLAAQVGGVQPGDVWYCDKPYRGTTRYAGMPTELADAEAFEARFWSWADDMSKRTALLVSEFTAPDPWRAIWSVHRHKEMSGGANRASASEDDTVFERLG